MHLTSPAQARAMEALIERGPMTLVFVYSTTCPHCHTYMPIWKRLCKQRQRRANMVSMEADVYQQTPMAAKKEVTGVPTVLFVDKEGRITEGEDIRNESMMNTAVSHGVSEAQINSGAVAPAKPSVANRVATPYPSTLTADSSIFTPRASNSMSESRASTSSRKVSEPPTPGSSVSPNPLHAVPAQPVPSPQVGGAHQVGGNPWSAFLSAAVRQAAPAAVLLGAYGMLPRNSRSSGLGAPRRTRRARRHRRA